VESRKIMSRLAQAFNNFILKYQKVMTQPCTCPSCTQKINSIPRNLFEKKFIDQLKSGQVVHIETRNGKPHYRQEW
jgi:transposase-like protein